MIGPALVLAVIVGLFHVSAYVFIRGRAGARLVLLVPAAVLGAFAGDTVGVRMAIDPVRVGDFNLVSASVVAWLAIGLVAILTILVPPRPVEGDTPQVATMLRRTGVPKAASESGTEPQAPA